MLNDKVTTEKVAIFSENIVKLCLLNEYFILRRNAEMKISVPRTSFSEAMKYLFLKTKI